VLSKIFLLHCGSKNETLLFSVTSPNTDRFSKLSTSKILLPISQGSIATHLRSGEITDGHFITNLLLSMRERIMKIGQYFVNLCTVGLSPFLTHSVYMPHFTRHSDKNKFLYLLCNQTIEHFPFEFIIHVLLKCSAEVHKLIIYTASQKNETRVILNILYSHKSITTKFIT